MLSCNYHPTPIITIMKDLISVLAVGLKLRHIPETVKKKIPGNPKTFVSDGMNS